MRCSRSARAFIFAAELAPDQYLLVGIGSSPSLMAFLLLGHLVTFPRTHRARSPTVLTFALLCAPRLRGRVPGFCDTIPARWRLSACRRGQARIIDHGHDGFQPHVAGPARPFVVPLEEDRNHETDDAILVWKGADHSVRRLISPSRRAMGGGIVELARMARVAARPAGQLAA